MAVVERFLLTSPQYVEIGEQGAIQCAAALKENRFLRILYLGVRCCKNGPMVGEEGVVFPCILLYLCHNKPLLGLQRRFHWSWTYPPCTRISTHGQFNA